MSIDDLGRETLSGTGWITSNASLTLLICLCIVRGVRIGFDLLDPVCPKRFILTYVFLYSMFSAFYLMYVLHEVLNIRLLLLFFELHISK